MAQMGGVLILALDLPAMFESLVDGEDVDNGAMVLGYVVMRVPMLLQWWRVSRQDPDRAPLARTMIASIVVSQVLWCVLALVDLSIGTFFALAVVPLLLELLGSVVAESRFAATPGTPTTSPSATGSW